MLHNLTIQITGLYSCQLKSLTIYVYMYVCVCKRGNGIKIFKGKRAKHQKTANIIERS